MSFNRREMFNTGTAQSSSRVGSGDSHMSSKNKENIEALISKFR